MLPDDIWVKIAGFMGHAAKHRLRRVDTRMNALMSEAIGVCADVRLGKVLDTRHERMSFCTYGVCRECCRKTDPDAATTVARTGLDAFGLKFFCTTCLQEPKGYRELLCARQVRRPENMSHRSFRSALADIKTAYAGQHGKRYIWAADWARVVDDRRLDVSSRATQIRKPLRFALGRKWAGWRGARSWK